MQRHPFFYLFTALFLLSLVFTVAGCLKQETVTVTVTDKERIVESSGEGTSSRYLIFTETEDGTVEVFENTDALWFGKFNSSDVQGQLRVDETYRLRVYGWRVPLLSMYRNIIDAEKL